jgi:uracil-DNA glycosylase
LSDPDSSRLCYVTAMTTEQESSVAGSYAALMRWYLDAGVDETTGAEPVNRFAGMEEPVPSAIASRSPPPASRPETRTRANIDRIGVAPEPRASPRPQPLSFLPEEMLVQHAVSLAADARSLAALREALDLFDGCPLKKTATNLVFGRGNPDARLVFVGEAPGAEEDLKGLPFVGPSGRLLDRILRSIDLGADDIFISNTVFWRPPGNRSPTSSETAACMPFLQRMLELIDPDIVVALGGPAGTALLGRTESVGKLRGRWFSFQTPGLARPAAATVTFHPAYLLRSPAQKRLAWRDWLAIKRKLAENQKIRDRAGNDGASGRVK